MILVSSEEAADSVQSAIADNLADPDAASSFLASANVTVLPGVGIPMYTMHTCQ